MHAALRGKENGSLHEITALQLATQALQAIRDRNNLDTALVDDVITGCRLARLVSRAPMTLARSAVINAGYAETTGGYQLNRFCASGLEATNMAAAKVMSGEADMAIGGGVESMSRVPMGSDGGAMGVDPEISFDNYIVPQGVSADLIATKYGFSRDDVDAYAMESQKRAAKAWDEGRFTKSVVPVKDQLGLTILDHDEHMRPGTDMQSLAALNPAFRDDRRCVGFDAVAIQRYPESRSSTMSTMPAIPPVSSMVRPRSWSARRRCGEKLGLKPRARIVSMASIGSGADHHADRPGRRRRSRRLKKGRHERQRYRSV